MASEAKETKKITTDTSGFKPNWPWSPILAVFFTIFLFLSQYLVAFVLLIYPALRGWDKSQTTSWLNGTWAQFVFTLLAEALTIGLLYWFIKRHKVGFKQLGWNRAPKWTDLGYALVGLVVFIIVAGIVNNLVGLIPGVNSNQPQQLGFNNPAGTGQLLIIFISLAILPPVVEETVFRGFLLGSLRKKLSLVYAVLGTSALFGLAHLQLGSGAPPLWAAAAQMFILSLVLCFVRVKSNSLWAGVMIHFLKNTLAFLILFVPVFTNYFNGLGS